MTQFLKRNILHIICGFEATEVVDMVAVVDTEAAVMEVVVEEPSDRICETLTFRRSNWYRSKRTFTWNTQTSLNVARRTPLIGELQSKLLSSEKMFLNRA